MSYMLRTRVITLCSLVGVLLLGLGTSASALPSPRYQHYVALGDSYTAGPLIPMQRLSPLGCFRSTNNYPTLLAGKLKAEDFTDVSCSAATTEHMTTEQKVFAGTNAPQLDALSDDTDLVTLGIGGNDFSVFGTVTGECPKLRENDPKGAPCQAKYADTFAKAYPEITQRIAAVLTGIHQRAPKAKVLVLGYPDIVPATGTCPDRLPLADGDYPFGRSVEISLDDAIRAATEQDGNASYVDTFTPTEDHDVCAKQPWINGKTLNPFAAMAYHPFREAMVAEAGLAYRLLGGDARAVLNTPYPVHGPVANEHQLRSATAG